MTIEFTIGADPEVFGYKPKRNSTTGEDIITDAQHRSLIGCLGGTKDNPIPLNVIPEYKEFELTIQEDNVAAEVGWAPAKSKQKWVDSCIAAWNSLSEVLASDKLLLHPSRLASVVFPDEQLNDPRAFMFGCEPDYNAWTGEINPRPHSDNPNLRSAGGHIHIGVNATDKEKISLVQYLDYYVGFALANFDGDVNRRQLYGKAGAMRFKPYGIEYRTPSNYWFVTDGMESKVYEWVRVALDAWSDKKKPPYFSTIPKALNHTDNEFISQLHTGLVRKGYIWYA